MIHSLALEQVQGRAAHAHAKLNGRTADSDTVTDLHRLAALGEEYGEVCRLLETGEPFDPADLYDELIDVANVALLWATYLIGETE